MLVGAGDQFTQVFATNVISSRASAPAFLFRARAVTCLLGTGADSDQAFRTSRLSQRPGSALQRSRSRPHVSMSGWQKANPRRRRCCARGDRLGRPSTDQVDSKGESPLKHPTSPPSGQSSTVVAGAAPCTRFHWHGCHPETLGVSVASQGWPRPSWRARALSCGEANGTRTPNPQLANSPMRFRERLIEHVGPPCGVPDHAGFVTDCSTFLGYVPGQVNTTGAVRSGLRAGSAVAATRHRFCTSARRKQLLGIQSNHLGKQLGTPLDSYAPEGPRVERVHGKRP